MSVHAAARRGSGLVLACVLAITVMTVPRSDASESAPTGCLVPYLRSLRIPAVRTELDWANCSLGTISHRATTPSKRGQVLAQYPPAGRSRPAGFPVNIVVGN